MMRIRQYRVQRRPMRHENRLARPPEKVDDRRAEEPEMHRRQRIQGPCSTRLANHALQHDVQRQTLAWPRRGKHRAEIDVNEIEFLWKAGIFDQLSKRRMRPCRIVEQRIVCVKTHLRDRYGSQRLPGQSAGLDVRGNGIDEQAVGQRGNERLLAVQVQSDGLQVKRT